MKILKFTLLSILCTTFIIVQLNAQFLPIEKSEPFEPKDEIISGPILFPEVELPILELCPLQVPPLEIYSIDETGQANFNLDDYLKFDYVEISSWIVKDGKDQSNGVLPGGFGIVVDNPIGDWRVVPNGFLPDELEECKEYVFRIMAICNKDTLYSNFDTYSNIGFCKGINSKLGLNEGTFTFYPQPAFNYVYVDNTKNLPIESINIYNLQGKNLIKIENNGSKSLPTIKLAELPSGVYITKIYTLNGLTYFNKIMIR